MAAGGSDEQKTPASRQARAGRQLAPPADRQDRRLRRVGLDELLVLLADLLGVLVRRAEQQLLQVVEQVLPGLLGHLPGGDGGLQVTDERGGRGGGRGQGAGPLARLLVAHRRRLVRLEGGGRAGGGRSGGGGGRPGARCRAGQQHDGQGGERRRQGRHEHGLSRGNAVYFVTADEGFYAGKETNNLAENLLREAEENGGAVRLLRNIEELLREWGGSKPTLADELRDLVADAVRTQLDEVLATQGDFVVSRRVSADIEVYLTEVHDHFGVSGCFKYLLGDARRPGGFQARARAEVSATATVVGIAVHEVRDIALDNGTIEFIAEEGTTRTSAMVFGRATLSLGGGLPTEPFTFRVSLDEVWPVSADAGAGSE